MCQGRTARVSVTWQQCHSNAETRWWIEATDMRGSSLVWAEGGQNGTWRHRTLYELAALLHELTDELVLRPPF